MAQCFRGQRKTMCTLDWTQCLGACLPAVSNNIVTWLGAKSKHWFTRNVSESDARSVGLAFLRLKLQKPEKCCSDKTRSTLIWQLRKRPTMDLQIYRYIGSWTYTVPRLQGCLLSLHAWLQPAANVSGCKPGRRRFCRCGVTVFLLQKNCLVVKSMLLPSVNMINVLRLNSSLPFCFFSLSFSLSPSLCILLDGTC